MIRLPLDYLLGFLAPAALVLGLVAGGLVWRAHVRARDLAPTVVLMILLQPLVWVSAEMAATEARERIFSALTAFAPTYAAEMAVLGHASVRDGTAANDPAYLRMLEAEKRWLAANPAAADIYTFRVHDDGRIVFVVDAETDYDHDGRIDGRREERTPIGEPMITASADAIRNALRGTVVMDDEVETDRWGSWISAYAPIPGPDGRPEALLGIDFPAEAYVAAVASARTRALLFAGAVGTVILALAVIIALLRRNVADREDRNARLDAAAREVQTLNAQLESRILERTAELERANRELESFAYTVSHDLRTPLRTIEGFAKLVEDENGERLSPESRQHLERVRRAGRHMAALIDDILRLSRVTRSELRLETVDVTALVRRLHAEQQQRNPDRHVRLTVDEGLTARADARLLEVLFSNLLDNSWKYTARCAEPSIEIGRRADGTWFVSDNGCGFDMRFVDKLFRPFQRLHPESEFEGNGIGLATVARAVERHGGRVQAHAEPDAGCTVTFTLGPAA